MLKSGRHDCGKNLEALEGTVERVVYHSEETGFCVLRVKQKGRRNLTAVVGSVPNVVPGESIEAKGEWVENREHGPQFQCAHLKTLPPDSLKGIEKYLGSGLIKGVGPVYAEKMVKQFGRDIFDVIENNSAHLERIEGIGRIRRLRIKESWSETRQVRAIMAFLMANGVSTARAFRIYKAYGDQAIQTVQADPYCLARDIRGIGFKTADAVAQKMGISPTSELRARAGVEHVLHEITSQGHCAYLRNGLIERAVEILEIPEEIINTAIEYGLSQCRLIEHDEGGGMSLIYLSTIFNAEVMLANRLLELSAGVHPMPATDEKKAIAWSEDKVGLELAPEQREAVRTALNEKVMVITGGPGVGKTTLINAILKIFLAKKLRVQLCAPTGRAAKRMTETTGCPAKTIHRLLAFDGAKGTFKFNDSTPLSGDVFIVDESSMIDVVLAWSLVRAIPHKAAVIFVGDVNQLPSVGPGMVLKDIIRSESISVCRLEHVFRQAAKSDIITNAHRINQGMSPFIREKGEQSDFFFAQAEEPEKAVELLVRMVKHAIPKKFGFDPMRDIQVLTPMRRGILGADSLNVVLQKSLNDTRQTIERYGCLYGVGDKVMQTQNNYDKDVFNGDIGRITKIDHDNGEVFVDFDGSLVIYDVQELDELVPSYAITIHKSQGSEYPCVVIPVHTQHYVMLQRNLIYTAVTRGRKLVVLVGTQKALFIAVKRRDSNERITRLAERMRQSSVMN